MLERHFFKQFTYTPLLIKLALLFITILKSIYYNFKHSIDIVLKLIFEYGYFLHTTFL
ncbi:MAG: hypothetical protein RLZZ306_1447 [Bacteroidota bacterium]|jgi:hypothetical protein